MFHLIPANAKRILEIGCGEGLLGKRLHEQGKYIAGIELVKEVAEKAKTNLDKVICCDIEKFSPDLEENFFDCLICGDVLEHLHNPLEVLKKLKKYLTEDAIIIASIPNIQHFSIIANLIAGNWNYKKSGLMDDTHLRFFTLKSTYKLFSDAGFKIEKTEITICNPKGKDKFKTAEERTDYWKQEKLQEKLNEILYILSDKDEKTKDIRISLTPFITYQYRIVAKRI